MPEITGITDQAWRNAAVRVIDVVHRLQASLPQLLCLFITNIFTFGHLLDGILPSFFTVGVGFGIRKLIANFLSLNRYLIDHNLTARVHTWALLLPPIWVYPNSSDGSASATLLFRSSSQRIEFLSLTAYTSI